MKKTKEIKVRLTQKEFERLNELVTATGLSREQFVRELLSGAKVKEKPPAEYGEILRELRRIGSNINQLLIKSRVLGFIDQPMLKESVNSIRKMDDIFTDSFV